MAQNYNPTPPQRHPGSVHFVYTPRAVSPGDTGYTMRERKSELYRLYRMPVVGDRRRVRCRVRRPFPSSAGPRTVYTSHTTDYTDPIEHTLTRTCTAHAHLYGQHRRTP